jgi:hypothetical protein
MQAEYAEPDLSAEHAEPDLPDKVCRTEYAGPNMPDAEKR